MPRAVRAPSASRTGPSSRRSSPATVRATPSGWRTGAGRTRTVPGSARPPSPMPRQTVVDAGWPLYEVFVRGKRGLNHVHAGVTRAAAPAAATPRGTAVYTRRSEGVSVWVALASDVAASAPEEKESLFAPSGDMCFGPPTFYSIPDDVPHM